MQSKYTMIAIVIGTILIAIVLGSLTLMSPRQSQSFEHECILIEQKVILAPNHYYQYTTERITVWDAGEYGTIVCNKSGVFQWAQKKSTLILQKLGNEILIKGIVHVQK